MYEMDIFQGSGGGMLSESFFIQASSEMQYGNSLMGYLNGYHI